MGEALGEFSPMECIYVYTHANWTRTRSQVTAMIDSFHGDKELPW